MGVATLPPPFPPAIMRCAGLAAEEQGVPRVLLLAIIRTESRGNTAALNRNANGTTDVGVMQVNSSWARKLAAEYGIRDADLHLARDACYNIRVGAWILKNEMGDAAGAGARDAAGAMEYWRRVGNYHSHTPGHNRSYRERVYANLRWITANTRWW